MIEDKIFKFKYRQNADNANDFTRRQRRVIDRFWERTKTRDPEIEKDLYEVYTSDAKVNTTAQFMLDYEKWDNLAERETNPVREYMAKEAISQYKDYYETDAEEQGFFEYLDNISNRDRIRFMEVGEDFSKNQNTH